MQTSQAKRKSRNRPDRGRRSDRKAGGNEAPPAAPAETFVEGSLNDPLRVILTHLRVPTICEHKPCRRSLRCIGTLRSTHGYEQVACWERHHDVLQPYFQQHIFPALKVAQARKESSEY